MPIEYRDDQQAEATRCIICLSRYTDLESHLALQHKNVTLQDYIRSMPGQFEKEMRLVEVTPEEAATHPGGVEGARIEKTLRSPREREYFRDACARLVDEGFQLSYLLPALAYQMLVATRRRAELEDATTRGALSNEGVIAAQLSAAETRIRDLYRDLRGMRRDKIEESATVDQLTLLETELREAEQWVQSHIGEFQESCPRCSQMLTVPGLPHWAFEAIRLRDGSLIWPVWSRELWQLVTAGALRLWQMAYVLRTAPEGLRVTAQRRGERWPEVDLEDEERLLRARLDQEDREAVLAERALLPPRKTGPLS